MAERRCGTCAHWGKVKQRGTTGRPCFAPVPESVNSTARHEMCKTSGKGCRCWVERAAKLLDGKEMGK